ncbi:hypothetical protein [Komarekiella delphini-convector]|uniref:hypothetical protein n=1 Tax=Komarekiella delphini-convector TaxID=3050158 RepID=UPI0032AEAE87
MNLNSRNTWIFLYCVLFATLLAVLAGFDGSVTVHVTPFGGLKVLINGHSADCLIDPQLPEDNGQSQPKLPEQKIA